MQIGWSPLISELANRGHKVTIISPRQMFKGKDIIRRYKIIKTRKYFEYITFMYIYVK